MLEFLEIYLPRPEPKFREPMQPKIKLIAEGVSENTVTMVPGTWAHGWFSTVIKSRMLRSRYEPSDAGQWFDGKSPFVTSLCVEDTRRYVLHWSERNSVDDRRAAALVLARHLDKLSEEQPNARHHVVAHSHGGNIALMALAHVEEVLKLDRYSFAAMSTPFIWNKPRNLEDMEFLSGRLSLAGFLAIAFVLSIPMVVLALFLIFPAWESHSLWREIWSGTIVGLALFLFAWIVLWMRRMRKVLLKKWRGAGDKRLVENDKDRYVSRLQHLSSVLIVQPPADEAWRVNNIGYFFVFIKLSFNASSLFCIGPISLQPTLDSLWTR